MNRMLPEAIRSSRPTNFFKQLCVESTGTASFTMFAPIGQLTNVTAFHQETKKRRSWNCGSGDFIVQPVASASNVRSAAWHRFCCQRVQAKSGQQGMDFAFGWCQQC